MTNCLITGATGFVGNHLLEKLIDEGFNIWAVVRHSPRPYTLPKECIPIRGDLLDIFSLRKAVRQSKPEYVFHLAALTPVRYSFDNPFVYAQTNYLGTLNMVHASLESPVLERFIHASTAEVYEPKMGLLIEEDRLYGSTPYGVSKVAAEYYVRMAGENYGLPCTVLRPCNTFGRRKECGYLVEKIVTTMLSSNELKLNGSPSPVRSWMFIDDHAEGYMACLDLKAEGQIFNLSLGNAISVKGIVEKIGEVLDWSGEVVYGSAPRPHDPHCLALSGEKMLKTLGWKPKTSLEEGILKTAEYWRKALKIG